MKLRSLDELEDAIDRETGWRKRELTTVLFNAQNEREAKRPTALRAGVALLYAHWEGWIRVVAECYVDYVAQQRLKYEELSEPFLALALKSQMSQFDRANKAHLHVDFAAFLRSGLTSRARFGSRGVIHTESNLSSKVLLDIVTRLGLDHGPYAGYAPLIDKQMLKRRNGIAHGEYLDLDLEEFRTLHSHVTNLLRDFTTDVLSKAAQRLYRL